MLELPLPSFPTGLVRGRFFPGDGQLYVCGMFSWAGSATYPGGLYRIRVTGQPMYLVTKLHASAQKLTLEFTQTLDPSSIDPSRVKIKTWSLKRTAEYGSAHYDEHDLEVTAATLADDGRSLALQIPQLAPTWCMEIAYTFRAADGALVEGVIHNTIHRLAEN